MEITKGMWVERTMFDYSRLLDVGMVYCVSQVNHNGTSIQVVGGKHIWYLINAFCIKQATEQNKEGSMASQSHWNTNDSSRIDDCNECGSCCDSDVYYDDACEECQDCRDRGHVHSPKPTVPYGTTNKGGSSMGLNNTIAKMYDSTEDAVLVNKWFGHEIRQDETSPILYDDHADAILALAKAKQAKEDARQNTVVARITE